MRVVGTLFKSVPKKDSVGNVSYTYAKVVKAFWNVEYPDIETSYDSNDSVNGTMTQGIRLSAFVPSYSSAKIEEAVNWANLVMEINGKKYSIVHKTRNQNTLIVKVGGPVRA